MIDADTLALVEGRNFAHVATLMADGAPHSVAVWIASHGEGRVAFFTQPTSQKARNLARDPRVAISIVGHDEPYKTARMRGAVAETLEGDEARVVIDEISDKYTGQDFPMPGGVLFVVEVAKSAFLELPFSH